MDPNSMTNPTLAKENRQTKVMFALIYLFFMSARAIFNPFITVYLQEKGLDVQWIGLVMSLNSCMILLAQPFWGLVSDKLRSVKTTLVICLIGQGLISLVLTPLSSFVLIAVCFCVYTFFSSSEGSLLDIWSLNSLKEIGDANAVGQLKLWGCLGFAASSVVSGLAIKKSSTAGILPIFAAVLVALGLIVYAVRRNARREPAVKLRDMNVSMILRNKPFILFLAFIILMQFPHRAAYTFYPALLTSLGGTKEMVGYCSAIMFVSEAVLLFVSRKLLAKVPPKVLICVSAFFFAIWQLGYALATQPYHLLLLSLLDGPSYALFTIGTLYYLDSIAPAALRTTYQTIAYACYFGMSGIIGNALGGWLIDAHGYRAMFLVGIAVIVCSTAAFWFADRLAHKNPGRGRPVQ